MRSRSAWWPRRSSRYRHACSQEKSEAAPWLAACAMRMELVAAAAQSAGAPRRHRSKAKPQGEWIGAEPMSASGATVAPA